MGAKFELRLIEDDALKIISIKMDTKTPNKNRKTKGKKKTL
jgi:hypothetical protein